MKRIIRASSGKGSYLSDYIDRDELHNMISYNPNFGSFNHYNLKPGLGIVTTSVERYDGIGPYGAVDAKERYWKVVKGPDDEFEVYETDKFGKMLGMPFPLNTTEKVINSATDESSQDEDLEVPEQEYDSAKTSINSTKLPAIYRMIHLNPGTTAVDYGGGKFDNAVEYMAEQDVTLYVYDPYNRSADHNRSVIRALKKNGGADAAINSNVLNVIKEPEARRAVLENIKKITKSGAPIYITVYEGRGTGEEGPTKSGYQLNRKTEGYLDEIREVFPNAKRRGKLIVATNSGSADSSIDIEASTSTVSEISRQINDTVHDTMVNDFGFPDDEVDDYTAVEIEDRDDSIYIEVRAELSFDALTDLADKLDDVVQKVDDDAYFEPAQPGILVCSMRDMGISSATSVNYGGVYDIDPKQYFTKDDLMDLADVVLEKVSDAYPVGRFDISDADINGQELYLELVELTSGVESGAKFNVDMRSIRKPRDLNKYANKVAESLIKDFSEYLSDADAVEGAYNNIPERPLDPPEPKELEEKEIEEEIELEIRDVTIAVDEYGSWEYEDVSWAESDEPDKKWYTYEDNIEIADPDKIIEDVNDLIENYIPGVEGNYKISCDIKLVYNITGVESDKEYYEDGSYDEELYTDRAEIDVDSSASEITNFTSNEI